MSVRTGRLGAVIGITAALALAGATPAMAQSAPDPGARLRSASDPAPVGPNQFFVGVVNDATVDARVEVLCDASGTTGHPRAGQNVAVLAALGAPNSPAGFTGAAGKMIEVGLGASTGPRAVLRLGFYQVPEPIPTSLVVPCTGSGTVSFAAAPASPTSRPATVKVTFVPLVA
jgi:hypothetical protein